MAKRNLQALAAATTANAGLTGIKRGAGLAGMVQAGGSQPLSNARQVPLTLIDVNPDQARQSFDEEALDELTASIRQHGVLQPIGLRAVADRYQIIFGERRFRAASDANLETIPALIYEDLTDEEASVLTALENLQREDLDLEEEARQFAKLLTLTGLSQRALADKLGKSHNYISRRIRLLKERPEAFAEIRAGRLNQEDALNFMAAARSAGAATESTHPETAPAVSAPLYHADTVAALPPVLVNGRAVYQHDTAADASALYHADTHTDDPALYQHDTVGPGSVRTPRSAMPAPTSATTFRPVERFASFVQRIQPRRVPLESRPALRAQLSEAITLAQAALRALDEGDSR